MKKINRPIIIFSSILLICLIFLPRVIGGKQQSENTIRENGGVKKYKVGLITKSTSSSFFQTVYSGASTASTAYNMDLVFKGPENEEDYETQNRMIREMVEDGVDAIIFSAIDYNANAEAIDEAAGKNVKIVVIDSDVNSTMVSCRIGTDNYKAGCMVGEGALRSEDEKLNIGIVNFDENSENGQGRERGFRDTVAKDLRATIVKKIKVLSSIESAKTGTQEMLKENPEINVIVTFNEWTSLGVGYAIDDMKLGPDTTVIAFDNNVVSVGMLETGEVDGLIVQNPYAMGYIGMETVYKLLNGFSLPKDLIDTDTILVDRNNMYDEECQRLLFAFDQKK
ncbi:substrate-binding domain-containing protein [Lachnospiraceae bacterium ZAX-1]